jgi:hypothetical protein
MLEPIMLINDFGRFHEAVGELVGRSVYTHEFSSIYNEQLTQEVKEAWERGSYASDEERSQRLCASFEAMAQYISENDKTTILVRLPTEDEQ